jgi:NADH:ubiquinone oxidoreductase subunit 2 (subunit N)
VIVLMYMQEPAPATAERGDPDGPAWLAGAGLLVPAAVTLAIGVFPQIVLGVLERASVLTW